jgi:predicted XRE-type DNA-binding protein
MHYTSESDKSFVRRILFDFVAQLEERLAVSQIKQSDVARKLNISESAVSQVLNLDRSNFSLETLVKYARALGMKVSLVAYDDKDPTNENGPVGSEIFSLSWAKLGMPRDTWSVNEVVAANYARQPVTYLGFTQGYTNSTSVAANDSTTWQMPLYMIEEFKKERRPHARD